ncbi:hypothetical protein Hanom_Chr06g00485511 [Helianthus anomalus]
MQQQEEGKGLHRGTPEHLSDVLISMETHYFDESFLRTEEDYGNTYLKSHLSWCLTGRVGGFNPT